jgi:hypothetical protein
MIRLAVLALAVVTSVTVGLAQTRRPCACTSSTAASSNPTPGAIS